MQDWGVHVRCEPIWRKPWHTGCIPTLNPSQQAMDNAAWDATASQFNECRTKMYVTCVSSSGIAMSCTPNLKLTSQILSITRRRKNLAAKDADGPLALHSIQDWGMREVNPYEESIMQRKHTNPKPITVSYGKCSLGCNRFPVQWMQDSMYVSCVSHHLEFQCLVPQTSSPLHENHQSPQDERNLQPGMQIVHISFTQCRSEVNLRCEIVPWAGMQWRPDGSRWHSPIEAICLHFPSPFRCARPPIRHSTLPHPLRKKCTRSSKLAFTPIEGGLDGWILALRMQSVILVDGWNVRIALAFLQHLLRCTHASSHYHVIQVKLTLYCHLLLGEWSNTLPTLGGVGHQWTIPISKGHF